MIKTNAGNDQLQ